jgi:predicted MFS family arabinose efflux permease
MEKAGFAMTLFGVGGILGPLVSGYIADRSNNKKWLLILGIFALIPLVLFFGNQTSFTLLAGLACALGFVNGYINTFLPLMVSEYSGPKWAATANGVTGCIFQMGAIIGPAVIGLSIDITGSFQTAWWLLAAGPMVGILFLISITKSQPAASPANC